MLCRQKRSSSGGAPSKIVKQATLPDSVLVQLIVAGNQQAFEMLIRRYQLALSRLIYRLLHDEDLVDDVLQHVWLQLYLSSSRLQNYRSVKSWLFSVARNRCFDLHRRKAPICFSELGIIEGEGERVLDESLLDFSAQPEEIAECHELQGRLLLAARHLSHIQYVVFLLRSAEELTFHEIGQRLGIPTSTAKTYFYRARKHISAELEAWAMVS